MLAWLERGQHNYAAALAELDQHILEGNGENTEDGIGRAAYWRARTLQDLEHRDEAEDAFAALIETRPFSYYAQQALARLEEIDHGRAQTLIRSLREDGPRGIARASRARRPPDSGSWPWRIRSLGERHASVKGAGNAS